MKYKVKDSKKSWGPVDLKLSFETQEELKSFLLLFNDTNKIKNVIRGELESGDGVGLDMKEEDIEFDFIPQDVWSQLKSSL